MKIYKSRKNKYRIVSPFNPYGATHKVQYKPIGFLNAIFKRWKDLDGEFYSKTFQAVQVIEKIIVTENLKEINNNLNN